MRKAILASLLILPMLGGCIALAAGAVGGLIIGKEVTDNSVYVTTVNLDVREVWAVTKTTMSDMSSELIDVDENLRVVKAKYNGASVTTWVEAFDLDKTTIRVSAEKFALRDGETAQIVMDKLTERLSH